MLETDVLKRTELSLKDPNEMVLINGGGWQVMEWGQDVIKEAAAP